MTAKTAARVKDIEPILSTPVDLEVAGIKCRVRHLKTRELFAFLGVFTQSLGTGVSAALNDMKDKSPEEVSGDVMGLVLVCAPLAIDPMISLIKTLVEPVDDEQALELYQQLDNPEIEDMLLIVDTVLENEKDNLASIMGKVRMYMTKWKGTVAAVRGLKPST